MRSPEYKSLKDLRPTSRTTECFPSPDTLPPIQKADLQQFLLLSVSFPAIKRKITKHGKRQEIQFEETAIIRTKLRCGRHVEINRLEFF